MRMKKVFLIVFIMLMLISANYFHVPVNDCFSGSDQIRFDDSYFARTAIQIPQPHPFDEIPDIVVTTRSLRPLKIIWSIYPVSESLFYVSSETIGGESLSADVNFSWVACQSGIKDSINPITDKR